MKTLKRLAAVFTVMAIALCGSGNSVSAYQWKNVLQDSSGTNVKTLIVSGTNIVAGTSSVQGMFVSSDKGASWRKAAGFPGLCVVNSLIKIGTDIIAGSSGLFISRDDGESWNKADGLPNVSIEKLTVIGSNIIADATITVPGYIYHYYQAFFISRDNGKSWSEGIGLPSETRYGDFSIIAVNGTYALAKSESGNLFLSADSGESWKELIPPSGSFKSPIAFVASNIIAVTTQGTFLSGDNGETWKNITPSSGDIASVLAGGSNIIAATTQGVFLSGDNGTSWKKVIEQPASLSRFTVSGAVIIATGFGNGFFISTDNGENWKEISGVLYLTSSGSDIIGIRIETSESNNVDTIVISTDNGETWNKTAELQRYGRLSVYAQSSPYIFASDSVSLFPGVVGTDSRYTYFSADNGASWKEVRIGSSGITVNALAVSDSRIFAGTGKGIFLSADNGETWNQTKICSKATALALRGSDMLANCSDRISLSGDNGATWKDYPSYFMNALAVSGNNIVAGTEGGIRLSADNMGNWKRISYPNLPIYSFAVGDANIFAGTSKGVFVSGDNGENWTAAAITGLPSSYVYVTALAVRGTDIFAGTLGHGVYVSSDNGNSWTAANTGLPSGIYFRALTVSGSYIFAGMDKGVFVSRDNGGTWESAGLDKDVSSLVIKGSKLFAGTASNSEIWVADISSECLNVGDDLTLDISCAEYQGKKYAFTLNYAPDSSEFFWKPDINTFREIQSAGNCVSVGENLSLNISCAQFRGKKYGFVLNYDNDLRWKMDVGTFTEK